MLGKVVRLALEETADVAEPFAKEIGATTKLVNVHAIQRSQSSIIGSVVALPQ